MVTKKKSTSTKAGKKGRVKVGKLKLNKETVKDLTGSQLKKLQGGRTVNTAAACSSPCDPPTRVLCRPLGG
jgi:hypothetical protein